MVNRSGDQFFASPGIPNDENMLVVLTGCNALPHQLMNSLRSPNPAAECSRVFLLQRLDVFALALDCCPRVFDHPLGSGLPTRDLSRKRLRLFDQFQSTLEIAPLQEKPRLSVQEDRLEQVHRLPPRN
jgi:hypothetical protein